MGKAADVTTAYMHEDFLPYDYFLMISQLDTTVANMDPTKQMVLNSNNFDRMRYLIDQLGSEELLFSMAFASSSYLVAKGEVEGRSFSNIKNRLKKILKEGFALSGRQFALLMLISIFYASTSIFHTASYTIGAK